MVVCSDERTDERRLDQEGLPSPVSIKRRCGPMPIR